MMHKRWVVGMAVLGLVGCASVSGDESDGETSTANVNAHVKDVTKADREKYLASSQMWSAEDFAKLGEKDLLVGPGGKGSFPATKNADGSLTYPEITCKFVEPSREHELGGLSPKFQCGECADGCTATKTLKVKFGKDADANGEIYGEVMATRLLWALGYKVDDVYPVRVTCKNCPEDPWATYKSFKPNEGARADRVFTSALIERKYDGPKIEESNWPEDKDSQGFAFEEVDKARRKMPGLGASDEHWAAFKLLAAFIKHADSKAANQRMVCPTDAVKDDKCTAPFLMIQDTGATFGGAGQIFGSIGDGTKARLHDWSGSKLWKDRNACQTNLFTHFSLIDPIVSEPGRAFLAGLMNKITDQHLRDIFTASRIVERGETIKENGQTRKVVVQDWINAFNAKRAELNQPCGR